MDNYGNLGGLPGFIVYFDDLAGADKSYDKAMESFERCKSILHELGLVSRKQNQ